MSVNTMAKFNQEREAYERSRKYIKEAAGKQVNIKISLNVETYLDDHRGLVPIPRQLQRAIVEYIEENIQSIGLQAFERIRQQYVAAGVEAKGELEGYLDEIDKLSKPTEQ